MEQTNTQESLKLEFLNLINRISGYFKYQKTLGVNYLDISPQSINKIKKLIIHIDDCSLIEQGLYNAKLFIIKDHLLSPNEIINTPYDGYAGKIIVKILQAMNLTKNDVYILSIDSTCKNINSCINYIKEQINLVKPKIILLFGDFITKIFLETNKPLYNLRGRFHNYKDIKVMATFHPDSFIKEPLKKRDVWTDIKIIIRELT
ncbi:MAG: hypothetical protein B6I26_06640 [Desulfobacteraceae bacterium 4572_130]|nr:MAG: hypothetical protein B6I26_06640 [Desulfobacteraceae bacterium 4572_130]